MYFNIIINSIKENKNLNKSQTKIDKVKSIFTSFDDVEIFEGDTVYDVYKKSPLIIGEGFRVNNNMTLHFDSTNYFSNKQTAENWLIDNAKVLSIEDINNNWQFREVRTNLNHNEKAVSGAKDTILYSIIGIVVALLAFAIVNFVLSSLKA